MGVLASVVITIVLLLVTGNGPAHADLLVASFETGQVLRYDDTTGAFLGVFATGLPYDHPVSMTVGPDGNLYVGVNNFVDPQTGPQGSERPRPKRGGGFVRRFDGRTGLFIGTFASGAYFLNAADVVFGPDGNLYVADFGRFAQSRVIRYDGTTGAFIDDFVPVGSGGLRGAEGLVFGPDGNLYVTSRVTNEVLRFDGSTGAFLGVFATGGTNGPVDLTFGPDGNLYVLTTLDGPGAVLRFDGSTGAFLDAFVGSLSNAADGANLTFGPDGNLYVTTGFIGNSVLRFHGSTGQAIDTFVTSGSGGLSYATGMTFTAPLPRARLNRHQAWGPHRLPLSGMIRSSTHGEGIRRRAERSDASRVAPAHCPDQRS